MPYRVLQIDQVAIEPQSQYKKVRRNRVVREKREIERRERERDLKYETPKRDREKLRDRKVSLSLKKS